MSGLINKFGAGFYFALAAAALALVSLIIYGINAASQYYNDINTQIITMTSFAIIFCAAAAILPQFNFAQNNIVKIATDILFVIAAVLLIWSVMIFIGDRVESLAYVFGSDLESDNMAAQSGTRQAVAGFVIYFIAWLFAVIGTFNCIVKKNA